MASVASPSDRTHIRLSGRAAGRLCQAPLALLGDGQANRSLASRGASRSVGTRPRTHRTRVGMWQRCGVLTCGTERVVERVSRRRVVLFQHAFREHSFFPSPAPPRAVLISRPAPLFPLRSCSSELSPAPFAIVVFSPPSIALYKALTTLSLGARERDAGSPATRVQSNTDRASQLTEVAESHLHDAQPGLLPLVW